MPTFVTEIEPLVARNQSNHNRLQAADRKSPALKRSAVKLASSRDRINQALGKPFVLYPLCAVMLIGALLLGLALRSPKSDATVAISLIEASENGPDDEIPKTEPALVTSDPTAPEIPEPELPEPELPEPELPEPGTAVQPEVETTPTSEPDASKTAEVPLVEEETSPEDNIDIPAPPSLPKLELVSTQIDVSELEEEFTGEAELVLDAGGFISEIKDIAISPDGAVLAAAGEKVVRIWDLETGRLMETLRGDRARTSYGDCYAAEFSPDNQFLVVGVNDYQPHGSIRIYRTDQLDQIDALLPGHTAPVRKLDFSADGKWMVSADADGHVAVWDWKQRKLIKMIPPRNPQQPIFDELHFPGPEPIIAGIDYDGPILLTVPELKQLDGSEPLPPYLHAWIIDVLTRRLSYPFESTDDPRNVDLRMDHQQFAAAGVGKEADKNKFWVGIWKAHQLSEPTNVNPEIVYGGHKWTVTAVDLSPDHQMVASGDKFGEIHVWNSITGERIHRFAGQGKPIYEAAFDRNSKRIAFGTRPFSVDRWDRNNYGSAERVIDLEQRAIYPISQADEISLIQEQPSIDGITLRVPPRSGQANMALEKLAGDRVVARYDLTTGRNPTVFSLLDQPQLSVQSPVLLGDSLGLLAMWDSDSDQLRRAFIGHEGLVSSVSYSNDRNLILSGSADRTLRIWNFDNYRDTGIFDFKFENSSVTNVIPGSSSAKAGVQVGDKILAIDGQSLADMFRLMLEGKFEYQPGQQVTVQMQRGSQPYDFEMTLSKGYDFVDPILSVFISNDDQWIIWTPQGYYDASPGAEQLIGFHVNRGPDKSAKYFNVQQFRKQLYRPDVIDRILTVETLAQALAASDGSVETEAQLDFRSPSDLLPSYPPEITFVSPIRGAQIDGAQVRSMANVVTRNGLPIREVTLVVNGVASEVFAPQDSAAQRLEIDRVVSLVAGRNLIELIAANSQSTSASHAVHVDAVLPTTGETQEIRRGILNVLAIGVSDYAGSNNKFADLPLAADDAVAFANMAATQSGGKLYSDVQTKVLTDELASKTDILDGLQWLVDNTRSGDAVAIFIAAHGFVDSTDNFYVGTHDVDLERPRATALSWSEFTRTLHEDLPECRRMVFLDLQPTEQAVAPGLRNPLLDLAAPEMATLFFSSNSLQQAKLPRPNGARGFSTEALLMALADPKADSQPAIPDSLLNANEVSRAWTKAVTQLSSNQLYPVSFAPESTKYVNFLQSNSSTKEPIQ